MKRFTSVLAAMLVTIVAMAQEIHEKPQKGDGIIGLHMDATTKLEAFHQILEGLDYLDILVDRADTLTWTIVADKVYRCLAGQAALNYSSVSFRIVEENGDIVAKAMIHSYDHTRIGNETVSRALPGAFGHSVIKGATALSKTLLETVSQMPHVKSMDFRRAKFHYDE